MSRSALPVDGVLPTVLDALRRHRSVVLEAPPGTGKTTRVPPALLDLVAADKTILVLEPRRLAARLSAQRVAHERGAAVGQEIGYQVRFDEAQSSHTRILYVTEGILQARVQEHGVRALDAVGALVFDEFHERHLASDLLLGLCRGRVPIVVMSATIDGQKLADYLGTEVVRAAAHAYPVEIEYLPRPSERPLEVEVAEAVRRVTLADPSGDVLVFLPGAAEIARAAMQLAPRADSLGFEVAVLHGDMSPAEQDRTLEAGARRKVILSTNVAETSLTLPRVTAVVDSGLHRQATHSPWSGLPELRVAPISRASATQRAGRAGRVAPGRCVRLYTRVDHDARPANEAPEVARADLTGAVLLLTALGVADFAWLDAPPVAAVQAAHTLLGRLGAVHAGQITALGRTLLSWPLHPRLGRVLYEAEKRGVGQEGAGVVALLAERPLQSGPRTAQVSGPSDPLHELDLMVNARSRDGYGAIGRAQKQLDGLRKRAKIAERQRGSLTPAQVDEALQRSLYAGYPDRVARRRRKGGAELLVAGGITAELSPASVVRDAEWMVAVDVIDRAQRGASARPVVRRASAISPDWLLDAQGDSGGVVEERSLGLTSAGRVERIERLLYDGLVIDESRTLTLAAADEAGAVRLLLDRARSRSRAELVDLVELAELEARVRFAAAHAPELAGLDAATLFDLRLERAIAQCVALGKASLAALAERNLVAELASELSATLDGWAPTHVTLPSGRRAAVQYQADEPFIAERLQDFFGQVDTPRIARGQVSVVLHLLGPNQRPLQVTRDLASFWDRTYPELKRQLSRRYPRHAWPDDPRHAAPSTGPTPRRR